MKLASRVLASLALLALAGPLRADESGALVVTLGGDTTSVERYTRTNDRLVVDQVARAPRTLRRHFVYEYEKGAISKVGMVVTPAGTATPTQVIDATFDADSMRATVKSGTAPPRDVRVAMPRGTLVVFASSPWACYEERIQQLVRGKSDTLGGVLFFVGAGAPERFLLRKAGRDSVDISNTHGDRYRAAVDKAGRVLGTLPLAGTARYAVRRVAELNLDELAATYLAREAAGTGVGALSPRDTVRVTDAGGAAITIDYGRPAKRGRVVFGDLVPYGEVWRTGANAATQFRTDQALDFGGTVVPAGFYTLWTIPTASGWKLLINSETGQWGTAHKPDKDLFTIDMSVTTLPQVVERFTIVVETSAQGGVLHLDWDDTRASAAFTAKR